MADLFVIFVPVIFFWFSTSKFNLFLVYIYINLFCFVKISYGFFDT
jgi:hypothetical protein